MVLGKKMKYIVPIVIIIGIVVFALLNASNGSNPIPKDDEIKIGFSIDTLVIERWQRDVDIFVAKAKELGAEVIVQNASEDNQKQIQQIKYLIDQNVDVLVIIPYDKDGITEVVKQAKKKGIYIISYDRLISNANVDYYISFDNEKVGYLMGEALLEANPTGNYVIVNGSPRDKNSSMFNNGFKKALEAAVEANEVNVIKEVWAEDWREEKAYETVDEILTNGEEISGIIGANDRLAEAAIQALAERRLAGSVAVVGHDADLSACQRIVEGTQLLTVYKPIKNLAEGAAELAVNLVEGKEVRYKNRINDGTFYVPFIKYDVIPVTKDNIIDTIVEDGFHSLEDIYRNIQKDKWPK